MRGLIWCCQGECQFSLEGTRTLELDERGLGWPGRLAGEGCCVKTWKQNREGAILSAVNLVMPVRAKFGH